MFLSLFLSLKYSLFPSILIFLPHPLLEFPFPFLPAKINSLLIILSSPFPPFSNTALPILPFQAHFLFPSTPTPLLSSVPSQVPVFSLFRSTLLYSPHHLLLSFTPFQNTPACPWCSWPPRARLSTSSGHCVTRDQQDMNISCKFIRNWQ